MLLLLPGFVRQQGEPASATTAAAITRPLMTARAMYQPPRTRSPKTSTPHRIDTIGSDRVRPGCAAISRPAFIADWSRNTPSAPAAIMP